MTTAARTAPPTAYVVVRAGTTAGAAVREAGLPVSGPDTVVVVRDSAGALRDLSWKPAEDIEVEPVSAGSEDGRSVIRHSAAHVLAQAVQQEFPDAKLGIGPPIRDGFYYDFLVDRPFTPDDLVKLESRMKKIIKGAQRFSRRVIEIEDARAELAGEPFKIELISDKSGADDPEVMEVGGSELTIYDNLDPRTGELVWKDLCRGPHIPTTKYIPAVKLMKSSAAYWRGDQSREGLQRIYGTAWESAEAQDAYLHMLEEAEKRDHRRVGKELELFHFDPTAPGMPYWLPKGVRLLNNLLNFWREEHEARGYEEIATPLVNHKKLWEISGHWDHYREDMFIIESDEHGKPDYALKPMNCPNAMVVYNIKTRSYRDLPLRLSDCDPLHRNERSGTLHGLLRVQKFQQDDAHIFVTPDQIRDEIQSIFDICDRFYGIFGLEYRFRLGTRPEGFIGDEDTWATAETTLISILDKHTGGEFEREEGGGAFYGPKIDILMSDVLGRSWQMGTIQLDFNLPRRFGCTYTDDEGNRSTPVVIHRVIYGSLERFLGIYIEHTAGAFPLWLSPVHVTAIPVAPDFAEYAHEVAAQLQQGGIRVEVDDRNDTLNSRVRVAQRSKVPYMLVLGARETANHTVSVREYGSRRLTEVPLDSFRDTVAAAIRARTPQPDFTELAAE